MSQHIKLVPKGLNDDISIVIDNKGNPPFTKKEQKQRLYEIFCEYLNDNNLNLIAIRDNIFN